MTGSSKTIIPEYYAPQNINLPEGASLYLYDARGTITKKYTLKKFDSEQFIWVAI